MGDSSSHNTVLVDMQGRIVYAGPRIGSAMVVFNNRGEFLLGRTTKGLARGQWVFPGGKIEEYESIADAGKRELFEETGLRVEYDGQIETRELINPPDTHRIVIFSYGHSFDEVHAYHLPPTSELSELQWATPRYAIGEPLTWFTRAFLKDNYTRLEKLAQDFKK